FLGPLHLSRSDYFPFTWDEGTYRGHVYVLPVDTDSRGMSYNKALFANAGLDPDNPPVQLAAVDDAAKKLTIPDAGGKYKQIGLIPWNHQGVYLFTWTPSFGGSLYDEATGKLTVNDPHNVHVLDWFHSYAAEYGYPLGGVNFPGGNLAMEIDGNQYVESTHASHPEMQIGVAPMPYPDGGRPDTTYAGGFGIAVLSGSKHPKEAATFAAYWVSAQTELTLAKATGSFPAVISAARDPFFRSDPYHDTFLMMLPRAIARPPVPILGTLWDELKATTNRVLKNNEVPQAVLDDVQTRMEALLEQTANGAH
ncbi:MAG TPA: extracellular solute-binding protein, partial [Limnochordia bacterium]|nr:extracellular solute-binding protein [Limnochordia bacterium]